MTARLSSTHVIELDELFKDAGCIEELIASGDLFYDLEEDIYPELEVDDIPVGHYYKITSRAEAL